MVASSPLGAPSRSLCIRPHPFSEAVTLFSSHGLEEAGPPIAGLGLNLQPRSPFRGTSGGVSLISEEGSDHTEVQMRPLVGR